MRQHEDSAVRGPILSACGSCQAFEARYAELSTKKKVYCHDARCSQWIPPSAIDQGTNVATCPACGKTTCAMCKNVSHTGDCPDDTALQQLLTTADAQQWQECFECRRFVELETGCNHMTCVPASRIASEMLTFFAAVDVVPSSVTYPACG